VQRGIQFYNESNEWQKNGSIDCYNIYVIGGTYKVSTIGFYTSGLAGNQLVDEIHFQNTNWEFSGSGWFSSLDNAKGDWSFINDTVKLTGNASTVMRIIGPDTNVKIDGMVIDLTNFKGSSVNLFNVDSGSHVDATRLTVVNPHNVKVVIGIGGGDVQVSYGARVDHPLPAIAEGTVDVSTDPTPQPTPDPQHSPPPDPLPSPEPSSLPPPADVADLASKLAAYGAMYSASAGDLNEAHIIKGFDSVTDDDQHHDSVDLSAIFTALGGRFTDGVNDAADRTAAVHFTTGDFDGDGKVDDVRLSIDGAKDFAISFVNPTSAALVNWGIGNSSSKYNDVFTGGTGTASKTAAVPSASAASLVAVSSQTNKLTFSDNTKAYTVQNFDNYYDSKNGVVTDPTHDTLNIGGVFDKIGGQYADGVNDVADRKAGLHLAIGDFNGDGKADDVRLTIDGAKDFSVTFLSPDCSGLSTWNIGEGKNWMDDIIIA
jgi:hypothetical protein